MRYEKSDVNKDRSYKQTVTDAYFKATKRYLMFDETTCMLAFVMGTVSHEGAVFDNGKLTFDGDIDWGMMKSDGVGAIRAKVDLNEAGTGTYALTMTGERTQNNITQIQKQTVEMKFENTATLPEVTVPSDLTESNNAEDCDVIDNIIGMGETFAGNLKITDGTLTTEFETFDNVSITKVAAATVYEIYDRTEYKNYTYYDFTDTTKGKVYYEDYFMDQEDLGEYLEIDAYYDYIDGELAFAEGVLTLTSDEAVVTMKLSGCGFPTELKCDIKAQGATPASTLTLTISKNHTMTAPTEDYLAGFTLKTE